VFTSNEEVRPIVFEEYELVLIDEGANHALMESYGGTDRQYSYPHLTILDAADAVLQQLVKGRLVTLSDTEPPRVEVTHEALIRGWHQLREWLDEDRDSLRILHQLVDAAEESQSNDRDPAYLYAGSRLSQVEEWRSQHADKLADIPLANEFIDAALECRDAEKRRREADEQQRLEMLQNLAETERASAEDQESSTRRLRVMLSVLAGLLLVSCVTGGFAYHTASELDERNAALSGANNKLQKAYDDLQDATENLKTERNKGLASSRIVQ
jgi:cell division protein FtsB